MTDLETAESTLIHKLFGDLTAAVPELTGVVYDSTNTGHGTLSANGKTYTYKLSTPALTLTTFQLQSQLLDGETVKHTVGWVKTEDSVTKILAVVKMLVTKYLSA